MCDREQNSSGSYLLTCTARIGVEGSTWAIICILIWHVLPVFGLSWSALGHVHCRTQGVSPRPTHVTSHLLLNCFPPVDFGIIRGLPCATHTAVAPWLRARANWLLQDCNVLHIWRYAILAAEVPRSAREHYTFDDHVRLKYVALGPW